MSFSNLHYIFPGSFYLCLMLLPILLLVWQLRRFRQKRLRAFSHEALSKLLISRSRGLEKLKITFFCISWLLFCYSLAGPYGNINTHQADGLDKFSKKSEIVFLLDVSASMGVKDSDQFSRLESSKEIIERLLPKIKGHSISLYAFTSELIPLVPLTADQLFFRMILRETQINEGGTQGTDISSILKKITPSSCSTLILFSDGGDEELSPTDLNLIAIGVGSEKGGVVPKVHKEGKEVISKLDVTQLNRLTSRYYEAQNYSEEDLSNKLREDIEENDKKCLLKEVSESSQIITYDLYYQIPLGMGLLFAILFFILPSTFKNNSLIVLFALLQIPLRASDPIETYNSAVEALKEKKWREGSLLLNSIDPEKAPSERFLLYLEENRSIALLQLSKEPYTDSNYALYLLKKSRNEATSAQKIDCLWYSCQGKEIKELIDLIDTEANQLKGKKDIESTKKSENSPELALEEVIESGKTALQLSIALDPHWKDFQKEIEKKLQNFVKAVILWEKKEYYRYHCQIEPWKEVIPLVQAGFTQFQIAFQALDRIGDSEALHYQNQALVNWKKALELIKNFKNEKNESPTYALDQLEEMYLQDQKKKQQGPAEWTEW